MRAKIRPTPGNFTAKALIMLNFGVNILQSHVCYSALLHDDVLGVLRRLSIQICCCTLKNFCEEQKGACFWREAKPITLFIGNLNALFAVSKLLAYGNNINKVWGRGRVANFPRLVCPLDIPLH